MKFVKMLCLSLFLAAGTFGMTACGGEDGGDDPMVDGGPGSPDANAGGDDDAAGGSLSFMDECDPADNQCEDGLTCFTFNSKGPHCTHDCTVDTDCEAPSTGCNNMGVCKAP